MKIKKSIVFFDVETTGLDKKEDRIIEIYLLKKNPDGSSEEYFSRFNPYPVLVSQGAYDVHGISSKDLETEPKFSDKAKEIIDFIGDSDIAGYNILFFDMPILFEEFFRCKILFDWKNRNILDSYRIWTHFEPRTLGGAVNKFLGREILNAHQAKADVEATADIFFKQMEMWFSEEDFETVSESTTEMSKKVDLSGKLKFDSEGDIAFSFGKYNNVKLSKIFIEDPSYLSWFISNSDFPSDSRFEARKIYHQLTANGK
jgi:DNA polymerase-3 subunit epsilon